MTARLRAGVEAPPPGGKTTVKMNAFGAEFWVSNTDLRLIANYSATAAGVFAFASIKAPNPYTPFAALGAILTAGYARDLAIRNPNGVILRCIGTPGLFCVPFTFRIVGQ